MTVYILLRMKYANAEGLLYDTVMTELVNIYKDHSDAVRAIPAMHEGKRVVYIRDTNVYDVKEDSVCYTIEEREVQ